MNILSSNSEKLNIAKQVIKKFLFILLIVMLYNTFLVTRSALEQNGAKEIFGYKAYIITTDSMKPTIKVGDVVIVEQVEEEELMLEDIITIKKPGEIITHRLVGILPGEEENQYITKGDYNTSEDVETVLYNQIEGKKILKIPFLGSILLLLRNKVYSFIIGIVIAIVWYHAVKKYKRKKMRREKQLYYTGGNH